MTQPTLDFTARAAPLNLPAESLRRQSAKARILAYLEQHGSATNTQLNAISFRYGGRLMELRQVGYIITSEPQGGGVWRYRLIGMKAG